MTWRGQRECTFLGSVNNVSPLTLTEPNSMAVRDLKTFYSWDRDFESR